MTDSLHTSQQERHTGTQPPECSSISVHLQPGKYNPSPPVPERRRVTLGGRDEASQGKGQAGKEGGEGGKGDLEVCHIRCPAGVTWSPAPTIKTRSAHVEVKLPAPQTGLSVALRMLCGIPPLPLPALPPEPPLPTDMPTAVSQPCSTLASPSPSPSPSPFPSPPPAEDETWRIGRPSEAPANDAKHYIVDAFQVAGVEREALCQHVPVVCKTQFLVCTGVCPCSCISSQGLTTNTFRQSDVWRFTSGGTDPSGRFRSGGVQGTNYGLTHNVPVTLIRMLMYIAT
ncbi:hypothetical protein E2C01_046927 [Portunus trituberculatus]|uniref:Uncharacterized protein n=1 Tax=Portunus trituberculatus TaxID=210409 RepID=A0A5B7G711_PORTR|nr:hypothetical protein [Portunus trituberculatus]